MGTKIKLKLKLSKSLKKHDRIKDVVKQGVEKIREINGYEEEKLHQNLTLSVMKSVNSACKYIDGEVDKNAIVVEILKTVYTLCDDEVTIIEQQIIDIIDNQELVSGFFCKTFRILSKLVKRQLRI